MSQNLIGAAIIISSGPRLITFPQSPHKLILDPELF